VSERHREPFWQTEAEVLWDERELERDRLAQQYEDEDAGRHYTSSDGSDPQSIEGRY
jgi:hypothetical protein